MLLIRVYIEIEMKKDNKKEDIIEIPYKVTPAGSLGVLALGHVGINAWREAKKNKQKNKTFKK